MAHELRHLVAPLRVGRWRPQNRIFSAGHAEAMAQDKSPAPSSAGTTRARGVGCALTIIGGSTGIHPSSRATARNMAASHDDSSIPAYRAMADAIHPVVEALRGPQSQPPAFTAASPLPPVLPGRRVRPTNDFIEFRNEEIEQSVPARFEEQVRRHSTRVAVKTRGDALTYDALNRAANRVASAILARRREAGAEPVALLLEQGAQAIVAMLGVLKAGKIYVGLDPAHPRARTDVALKNAQPGLLVTNRKHLPMAQELGRGRLATLDVDELDPRASDANPAVSISPDQLAYILYTSGSTGTPKGVVHNHRNLLHDSRNRTNLFHISADDRCSLLSFGTGQAIKNIFTVLLNGAALYPLNVREEGAAHLAGWLIREEITVYESSASLFRSLCDALTGREQFPRLRLIRLGSEAVSRKDVELCRAHFSSDCILVNLLASVEAGSLRCYLIDKETPLTGDLVPVGYAVEDIEVLLLDDTGEEVGCSRVGEIVVRSRDLSPGLLGGGRT